MRFNIIKINYLNGFIGVLTSNSRKCQKLSDYQAMLACVLLISSCCTIIIALTTAYFLATIAQLAISSNLQSVSSGEKYEICIGNYQAI